MDRLPPHSPESEKGILGCIMLNPKDSLAECAEAGIGPESFYIDVHAELYKIKAELVQFDIVTLAEKLRSLGRLDAIGGLPFLSSLMDSAPSAASLNYYIPIVKEKAKLRKLLYTCQNAVLSVYSTENAEELLENTEREILSIRNEKSNSETRTAKELIHSVTNKIEEYHQNQGKIMGLSTGLRDLDKLLNGISGAKLIFVAARQSCGKTSLAMNIADHVAVDQKIPVAIFSLETVADELMFRMTCSRARMDSERVRRGELIQEDFQKLTIAGGKLAHAPLYIRDRSGINLNYLQAAARKLHQEHGIGLFILDYMQLMSNQTKFGQNREREVAQNSNGIKALVNDLKVPFIVISSLNRDCDAENRKPRPSDIRESGAIEYDANQIWLLYRPAPEPGQSNNPADIEHQVNLEVAKNKDGKLGTVKLWFRKQYTRFENMSRVGE